MVTENDRHGEMVSVGSEIARPKPDPAGEVLPSISACGPIREGGGGPEDHTKIPSLSVLGEWRST